MIMSVVKNTLTKSMQTLELSNLVWMAHFAQSSLAICYC